MSAPWHIFLVEAVGTEAVPEPPLRQGPASLAFRFLNLQTPVITLSPFILICLVFLLQILYLRHSSFFFFLLSSTPCLCDVSSQFKLITKLQYRRLRNDSIVFPKNRRQRD
jgi:hypothetical protein